MGGVAALAECGGVYLGAWARPMLGWVIGGLQRRANLSNLSSTLTGTLAREWEPSLQLNNLGFGGPER